MTKENWQNLFDVLSNLSNDFSFHYYNYKNGKNKKIRADAEKKIDNVLKLADFYINKHPEAFELLIGDQNHSEYGRAIVYDEFMDFRYFGRDMDVFLEKIKDKIKSL